MTPKKLFIVLRKGIKKMICGKINFNVNYPQEKSFPFSKFESIKTIIKEFSKPGK